MKTKIEISLENYTIMDEASRYEFIDERIMIEKEEERREFKQKTPTEAGV